MVSDHYPALSFQARQFLKIQESTTIKPPFVMDVFFLDVLTEFLCSPIYFLSYIDRRTAYGDRILATHELTVLSYHLKQNLWVDEQYTMMHLGDDISADLDLAMVVRRENAPGPATPEGILTKFEGSYFSRIVRDIEGKEHSATVNLGFELLKCSGDAIEMLNDGISQIMARAHDDGKPHDFTLGIREGSSGLTIHCNDLVDEEASRKLEGHSLRRKYSQRAKTWYGICLGARPPGLRFIQSFDFEWTQDDQMDELVGRMAKPENTRHRKKANFNTVRKRNKIGRNEKCPCGSGKKYKKCCLNK